VAPHALRRRTRAVGDDPDVEWDGLAAQAPNPHAAERLRGRLALSLLSRPALIVIFAHPGFETARGTRLRLKRDVERIVQRIRSWDISTEVIGAWMHESWDAEESLIESRELKRPGISILRGDVRPQWLAESVWENEGGRVGHTRDTPSASKARQTSLRKKHAVPDHRRRAGHPKARQGASPRDALSGLPGFRSDLAGVAGS
jgi:hypothetical protein